MERRRTMFVITGASNGFGEVAVKAFADAGYRVWGTMREAEGRNAEKRSALEGYSRSLRYELAPFGVDVAIVQPGPFGTGLLAQGMPPALTDVLSSYGDLALVPPAMAVQGAEMLASDDAPNPRWVVDACLELAQTPAGKRSVRTQIGISWGVDEINRITQPIQDRILTAMQLDALLGRGVDSATGQSA